MRLAISMLRPRKLCSNGWRSLKTGGPSGKPASESLPAQQAGEQFLLPKSIPPKPECVLSSTLRIYARLLQTQAQKFAASETMRTACSMEGCHRYRSKGILERAEFINVPARPG
jgi:hypothetical protein